MNKFNANTFQIKSIHQTQILFDFKSQPFSYPQRYVSNESTPKAYVYVQREIGNQLGLLLV